MNTKIKVGDIVKGISDNYRITNRDMTRATVTEVYKDGNISLVVTEHMDTQLVGNRFTVLKPECFEVVGHVKPFDRDAVMNELKNGNKAVLYEYDLCGANLSDANLRGADLRGANLSGANLSGANLCGANLRGASMGGADLCGANLCGANLRGASMGGADLCGANLSGANLSGANLCGANLCGASMGGADLCDADLIGANLYKAGLYGADLGGAELDFSCLPLWCGSLHMKIDKRLASQIAYHLCSVECDDPEYIRMRNSILWFANQFHRADECGILVERAISKTEENEKE